MRQQLTIIKTKKQYYKYCDEVEYLSGQKESKEINDRIELLILLIEKWDNEHYPIKKQDPVQLLKYLMKENRLRSVDLVNELDINKTVLSKILHYEVGFSKEIIRKLANRFKVTQEAFNRPYSLKIPAKRNIKRKMVHA